ncbi:hypothetical protein RAZWK3B_03275 [Roseobacter sp. AzwK-3b]|uniref:hypothetical protein n=1 Tax=Roseobacter sp. AzwK-3b TaxID=351016 RepID=UPI0001568E37|nr:hypothetical protein [Roseobacter sp. AzwK-3b]EDM73209.1 hypothetical protein RAZWK3B_03275 [Roseobacter sp. AzwK-3b]
MRSLEAELGLADMSAVELDALAAAVDLSALKTWFRTKDVVQHPILSNVSRATQYRAVQALEDKGFIAAHPGANGEYMLVEDDDLMDTFQKAKLSVVS